jgi:hypothetical protein
MDISSLNSNSNQNIQSLQDLFSSLYPTGQTSSSGVDALFSKALQSAQGPSTNGNQSVDGLSMLQALQNYNSITNTDPFLQAFDESDSQNNNDTIDSMFNSLANPISSNPYSDQNAMPLDSNYALIKALQNSGMSSSQMDQVLNYIQMNSQYNQQGNVNSLTDTLPGLFSTSA